MAQITNPHKKFQFSIFIVGMNPFLAQKVTLADREIEKVEHGEGNHLVKTAGMVKIGDLKIEKMMSASAPDRLFWAWVALIQNEVTGGGTIPEVYKKAAQVQLLGNDGVSVIRTWNYVGLWPFKINGIELDRVSSDNTVESIEFSVDQEILA